MPTTIQIGGLGAPAQFPSPQDPIDELIDLIRMIDPGNPINGQSDANSFCANVLRGLRKYGQYPAQPPGVIFNNQGHVMPRQGYTPPVPVPEDSAEEEPSDFENERRKRLLESINEAAKQMTFPPESVPMKAACECGSESVGGGSHATYCPMR